MLEKLLKIYLLGAAVLLGWKYQGHRFPVVSARMASIRLLPANERGLSITKAIRPQSVSYGQPLFLYVEATSVRTRQLRYQWYFNNAPIRGGDGPTLTVLEFGRRQEGLYSVAVSDSQERVQSPQVRVTLDRGLPTSGAPRAAASAR